MGDDANRPPATGYPVNPSHPSTANGYPYPAPPNPQPPQSNPYYFNQAQPPPPHQHAYYPNYDYNNNNANQQRQLFLRRVVTGMLAVFILIGAILFITWAILRPQFPQFQIDSASLTNFNLTSSSVTGDWEFNLTVFNPNKKVSVRYDLVEAGLSHKSNLITDTTLAPFAQGTRNETKIRVSFATAGAYMSEKSVEKIGKDRSDDGVVEFEVRVYSRVYFDAGAWRMRRRLLRVLCEGVGIKIPDGSAAGNMTGGAKGCRVGW